MTETQTKYTTPGTHNLQIPSIEEFHRYANNLITDGDFDATHPSGNQIGKVDSALRWTYKNQNPFRYKLKHAKEKNQNA